ncbi:Uncharacterised protein [Bordetella pertussis]|nr:Uncharacterised protein [Bordetella pertussis]CFW41660.1 Uncharacterised protein [Bordetella pertussis]
MNGRSRVSASASVQARKMNSRYSVSAMGRTVIRPRKKYRYKRLMDEAPAPRRAGGRGRRA